MNFLQNQNIFIVKVFYESRSYKFVHEQLIAKFPDREPSIKLSISHLIRKFETTGSVDRMFGVYTVSLIGCLDQLFWFLNHIMCLDCLFCCLLCLCSSSGLSGQYICLSKHCVWPPRHPGCWRCLFGCVFIVSLTFWTVCLTVYTFFLELKLLGWGFRISFGWY